MVEKIDEELVEINKSLFDRELVNPRFISTIIMSILTIGIITLLIWSFPVLPSRVDTLSDTEFNNFFYQWTYKFERETQYHDSYYQYVDFYVDLGYIIIMPFFVVLTFLSGSMIFLKTRREIKITAYTNWVLYSIPIILALVKVGLTNNVGHFDNKRSMILGTLAVYSLCYLPNQILMFVNKSNLSEWLGFTLRPDIENQNKFVKELRIINIILNCIVLIYLVYIPIVPIRYFNLLADSPYSKDFNFFVNPDSIINGIIFSSVLLIYGLTFTKFLKTKRIPSAIIALVIPYVLFFMTYAVTYFSTYSDFMDQALNFGRLRIYSYNDFLISYLFYTSLFLFLSIPTGFYCKKKDYLIIAAINSIVLVVFIIIGVKGYSKYYPFFDDSYNLIKKILLSLLYPFMIGIVFLGAFWGNFLRKRFDKIFMLSTNQQNNNINEIVQESQIKD